jgi:3-oxoacid CoA-transferase
MIEYETRKLSTKEWQERFEGSGLPFAVVNDVLGTMGHEHGKLTRLPSYIDYSSTSSYIAS